MKVNQLIEELKKLPQDATVRIYKSCPYYGDMSWEDLNESDLYLSQRDNRVEIGN